MRHVLFVCTGNTFRSLTAEYALRQALGSHSDIVVSSAGTADRPYAVDPVVARHLRSHGLDVSRHVRRTLTADMMQPAVTVIAMSTDHREYMARHFGRHDVPLFTQACGLEPAPLPDVHEAVPDHAANPAAAEAHMRSTIDRVLELTPHLASRLIRFTTTERWRPATILHPETLRARRAYA